MNHDHFIVPPGKEIRLKDYDPGFTSHYKNKDEASAKLRKDIKRLAKYQDVLYAQNTYALLVMLQAMDTAGKDGTIRHVMSGVNPQGTQVHSLIYRKKSRSVGYSRASIRRRRIGSFPLPMQKSGCIGTTT